jgi:outer membrane protein assembly factor BamA
LIFHITEGQQYKLSSPINYVGFENVPKEVQNRLDTAKKFHTGDAFNEQQIENEIRSVHNILSRTGYMRAAWDYPKVIMDTENFKDSVVAFFYIC